MVARAVGVLAFVASVAALIALAGFLSGVPLPRTIDEGRATSWGAALAVDLLLVGLFGLQHSLMARARFERWWASVMSARLERAAFLLAASLALGLLIGLWQPLPASIWKVENPLLQTLLRALGGCGWLVMLVSTLELDALEFFGLSQVFRRTTAARAGAPLRVRGLHRIIRHPTYLGWLAVLWSTPAMSAGRLLLAAALTIYVLIAIRFEERDLLRAHGVGYEQYRRDVPALVPSLRRFPARAPPRG